MPDSGVGWVKMPRCIAVVIGSAAQHQFTIVIGREFRQFILRCQFGHEEGDVGSVEAGMALVVCAFRVIGRSIISVR